MLHVIYIGLIIGVYTYYRTKANSLESRIKAKNENLAGVRKALSEKQAECGQLRVKHRKYRENVTDAVMELNSTICN